MLVFINYVHILTQAVLCSTSYILVDLCIWDRGQVMLIIHPFNVPINLEHKHFKSTLQFGLRLVILYVGIWNWEFDLLFHSLFEVWESGVNKTRMLSQWKTDYECPEWILFIQTSPFTLELLSQKVMISLFLFFIISFNIGSVLSVFLI